MSFFWVRSVHASGLSLGKVGIGSVLTTVLQLCYKHQVCGNMTTSTVCIADMVMRLLQVRLEGRYSSLIVALGVMEGIGRQLDPEVDLMKMAAPYVLHAVANRAIEMVTPAAYHSNRKNMYTQLVPRDEIETQGILPCK